MATSIARLRRRRGSVLVVGEFNIGSGLFSGVILGQ
jgi:hypothetical protein